MAQSWKLAWILILASLTAQPAKALNCYQCGTYSLSGAGSVSPCYRFDETNLKQCAPSETHCLKYVNEGIIVRQCVSQCKPGVQGQTEFYCCQTDGCNSAGLAKVTWAALLPCTFIATWLVLAK